MCFALLFYVKKTNKVFSDKIALLEKTNNDNNLVISDLNQKILTLTASNSKLEKEKNELSENVVFLHKNHLTPKNYVKSFFPEFFVIGDSSTGNFYKFYRSGEIFVICCGGGFSNDSIGAIRSVVNVIFLNEILEKSDLSKISAGDVLDMIRDKYSHLEDFLKDRQQVDFSVCIFNKKAKTLDFSSSFSGLYLVRKSYPGTSRKEVDVHEFTGDRMTFKVSLGHRKKFSSCLIELEKDDRIYLKAGQNLSRETILENASLTMKEQSEAYKNALVNGGLLIGVDLKVKNSNEIS